MTAKYIQLDDIRKNKKLLSSIIYSLLACFMFVFYSPSALALHYVLESKQVPKTSSEKLMDGLVNLERLTREVLFYSKDEPQKVKVLERYEDNLSILDSKLQKYAKGTRKELESYWDVLDSVESETVKEMQSQLIASFDKYWPMIDRNLNEQLKGEDTNIESVEALYQLLTQFKIGPEHHKYDSENMPFGSLPNVAYTPSQDMSSLLTRLDIEISPAIARASFVRNISVDDYLQFNIDTAQTLELTELAETLERNPQKIFQYVYNNIEYVPAFGSIQGADYTVQTERGNAFDQASLMIALLRASGVPSRYVYGSVDVNPSNVMNWVGGVNEVEAAQNLLGQGGVPNIIVKSSNGDTVSFNIEHVWVEFYQNGEWVAADPSFKQYDYTTPLDINSIMTFDSEKFVSKIVEGLVVDEVNGWVKGLNQENLILQLQEMQSQSESYINSQSVTLGEVIGTKNIVQLVGDRIPRLPYLKVRASQSLKFLPDNLRHKFKYELNDGSGVFSNTILSFVVSLPEILSSRLAMSFAPSTQQDIDALIDYLPSDYTSSSVPSSLPYGLINLKARISIDESVILEGGSIPLGKELSSRKGFWTPRFGWELEESPVITGEYHAIGIDSHGVSKRVIEDIANVASEAKSYLDQGATEKVSNHNTIGAVLQTGIQSFMVESNMMSKLAALESGVVHYRQPSFGTFSNSISVSYLFGLPSKIEFSGVVMDVDRLSDNAEAKSNCRDRWMTFNRNSGAAASYLEHSIPEKLFSDNNGGVSAVKLIGLANSQGQKLYTFDKANISLVENLSLHNDVRQEIYQAVQVGNTVTIHESPITVNGWSGYGYVKIDPETGSGAYKISGGANGGALSTIFASIGGFFDGQSKFKDHWFNPGNSPLYSRLAKMFGNASLTISIIDTILNPDLTTSQKVGQIVINTAAFIGSYALSSYLVSTLGVGLVVGGPVIMLSLLLVTLAILQSILISLIIESYLTNRNYKENKEGLLA